MRALFVALTITALASACATTDNTAATQSPLCTAADQAAGLCGGPFDSPADVSEDVALAAYPNYVLDAARDTGCDSNGNGFRCHVHLTSSLGGVLFTCGFDCGQDYTPDTDTSFSWTCTFDECHFGA